MSTEHLKRGSKCPKKCEGILRLYSMKYCPYAQRVRILLTIKDIPHEIVNVSIFNKPDWLYQLNPLGEVPVLDIGSRMITESLVICEYLDKLYPIPSLYSDNKEQRDRDLLLLKEFDQFLCIFYQILRTGDCRNMKHLLKYLKRLDGELNQRGRYFGGDQARIVDFMIWPWAERALLFEEFLIDNTAYDGIYPNLFSWYADMHQNDIAQKTKTNVEAQCRIYADIRKGVTNIDCDI